MPNDQPIKPPAYEPNEIFPYEGEGFEKEPVDAEYMVIRYLIKQSLAKDPLTKISNRRFYDEEIKKQVARVQRHEKEGAKVGLIMIDVDKFKEVNDKHGHPAGDRVLSGLANILENNVRTEDIVARYGGEEFAIIAPDTDLEGLMGLAEKLRKIVEEETRNKDYPPVTISIGYAEFKSEDEELNDVIKLQIAADTALYNSKADGRNRTAAYRKGLTMPEKEGVTRSVHDAEMEVAVNKLLKKPEETDKALKLIAKHLPDDPRERLLVLEILAKEAKAAIGAVRIRKTGTDG